MAADSVIEMRCRNREQGLRRREEFSGLLRQANVEWSYPLEGKAALITEFSSKYAVCACAACSILSLFAESIYKYRHAEIIRSRL